MNKAIVIALALTFSAWAVSAQSQAPVPQKKGQSADKKATPNSRSGWDLHKGTGAKKQPKSSTNTRNSQGIDAQGTEAQGVQR
jgi:hypothetical protein